MKAFVYARCREAGNVLFIIFIAIALFGALSYSVTQSSRGGSKDASSEITTLDAAQIVQYATSIEQAVLRIRVIGGCSDKEISFERAPFDDSDTDYLNPFDRADFACHVFHPNGGGASPQTPPEGTLVSSLSAWVGYGAYLFTDARINNNTGGRIGENCWTPDSDGHNPCNELFLYLTYISRQTCLELNERLNVTNPGGEPPVLVFRNNNLRYWKGAATNGSIYHLDSNEMHMAACHEGQANTTYLQTANLDFSEKYFFYYVLIAR